MNQQLMLFVAVLSKMLIASGNKATISTYFISDPDTFTGGDFDTECNILSAGPVWNLTGCLIMNSPRLIDGVTGEGSSPLNTDQFVGWDNQSHDTFIIVPDFDPNLAPRQVDIFFHNDPAMGIGLPPIAVIYVGFNTPHGTTGPIPFTYANNQQLIENNDNTTMISVVMTKDYESLGIPTSFTSFWIEFNFSSTPLSQALISEIEIFIEPVNITSGGEITFLSVSDDTDLGRDNLVSSVEVSCTLAIDGQFSWSWTGPDGAALDVSHISVLTADLTCTSILKINNLSLSDAGQYTCTASLSDGPINYPQTARSSTIRINLEGIVSTSGDLTTTIGQSVSMTCDFSGYLPGAYNITWTGLQGAVLTSSGRHAISIANGLNQSQSGGDSPGSSVLSTLTVSNTEEEDSGIYVCNMSGNNNIHLKGNVHLVVKIRPASTMVSSPTPSTSALPLIGVVGIAIGVFLCVFAICIISVIAVCYKRRRNKLAQENSPYYSTISTPAPYEVPIATPNTTSSVGDRKLAIDNLAYDNNTQADDTDRTCATASSGSVHQLPTGTLTESAECKHDSVEETSSVEELNVNNSNSPIPHHKRCDSPQELPTVTLSSDETLTQEGHPTLEYIKTEGMQVNQKNDGSIKLQDTSCLSTPIPVVVVSCENEDSKVVADLSN